MFDVFPIHVLHNLESQAQYKSVQKAKNLWVGHVHSSWGGICPSVWTPLYGTCWSIHINNPFYPLMSQDVTSCLIVCTEHQPSKKSARATQSNAFLIIIILLSPKKALHRFIFSRKKKKVCKSKFPLDIFCIIYIPLNVICFKGKWSFWLTTNLLTTQIIISTVNLI